MKRQAERSRAIDGIRHPPLTAAERLVMFDLATGVLAEHWSADVHTAAAAILQSEMRGEVALRTDSNDVYLDVSGSVIVHTERDWLRWFTTTT
jgi:hypothetical protein